VPFFAGCLIAAIAGVAVAQPTQPAPPTAGPPPAPPPMGPQPAPAGPQPEQQPQPAEPPSEPEPEQEPDEQPAIPEPRAKRNDAGWRLYHGAFEALLRGKRNQAKALAARLRREHAGHPAAAMLDSSPLAVRRSRGAHREEPTSSATAELALFQTLHGLALGVELCIALECDDGEAGVGLSLVGGGIGAIASLKGVGPLTSGQRALLNSGTAWGAFNAITAIIAFDPDDAQDIALGLIGGQVGGLTLGALLYDRRPTAGQVALASSGGQWGAVLMALTLAAASTDPGEREVSLSLLVAGDVGLGMGAYLATLLPDISRSQTLVIDAGGIVGGIGGGGLGVLISGSTDDRSTAAVAALGVAAGLGAAAYLTRDWDDSDDDDGNGARAIFMPAERGGGGMIGLAGSW
jgi:hypothetical protein